MKQGRISRVIELYIVVLHGLGLLNRVHVFLASYITAGGTFDSLRPHVPVPGWQQRLSRHVLPDAHDTPSTPIGDVEPPSMGADVSGGAAGLESGEVVRTVVGCGPLVLGSGATDAAAGVGSGESVREVLGWGVSSRVLEGTRVGLSNTAGSSVVGAAVGGSREDGARVLPYSSSVERGTPAQLHSS